MARVLILLLSILCFLTNTFAQSTLSENELKFIPNKGQWHPDIKFKAELKEGDLLVFDTKLRYEFYDAEQLADLQHQLHSNTREVEMSINAHAFEISFLNAQTPDSISGNDAFADKRNYIYPEGNFSNIRCYNKITLHNLYEGVDLVLFQKNASLKYEFHVQRKTPTEQIQLSFNGQDSLYLKNGYLITKTSVNAIAEEPPYAYQVQGDLYKKVECQFNLEGNVLSYDLGKYDQRKDLVIDPQLIFSTYSGSTADNWGNTACLDNKGNLYTGGTVFKYKGGTFTLTGVGQFPATVGAFQQSFQGGDTDIGILKFDSSGVNLEYATYIGGNGSEIPTSTITNAKGELYILGITSSTDIPTSDNSAQPELSPNLPPVFWTKNGEFVNAGTSFSSSVLPNDTVQAYSIGSSRCNLQDTILSEQYIVKPKTDDISILGDSSFCVGDSLGFIVISNGVNDIISTVWKVNNTPTDSAASTLVKSPKNNDLVTATVVYKDCKGDTLIISKTVKLYDANNLNSSIELNIAKDSTLCTNQMVQFSAATRFGGLNPVVDWYLDDIQIAVNTMNISYSSNQRGKLYAKLTSSMGCLAEQISFSDSVSIDTTLTETLPILLLSHNKNLTNDAECVGSVTTNVEFDYLGTQNTYFWFINSSYLGSSSNPVVRTPIKENDTLTVTVLSNNGCLRGSSTNSVIATIENVNSESIDISEISYCDSTIQLRARQTGGSYVSDTNWIPVGGYSFNRTTDLVVLHLSADGSELLHSTYLGGSSNDGILYKGDPLTLNYGDQLRGDINIDDEGFVYIASTTSSSDFPVKNAVQPIYGGGRSDAVLVKIAPDFSELAWSTFIGGDKMETGMSVKRDKDNNVYIAGGTTSENFNAKSTLSDFSLGKGDAYLSKYSSDGQTLINSVKFGTPETDQAYFLEIDDNDDLYLLGQTFGKYPIKNVKYKNPNSGLFIQKINSTFDKTIFSTVIGDLDSTDNIKPLISPTAFLVNECQNIFIAGWGGGTNEDYPTEGLMRNMPTTSNAFQRTTDGSDFYLMALLQNADSLLYATYFGGSTSDEHVDGGTSRFDEKGIVYQSVCAGCGSNNDFPQFPAPDGDPSTYPKSNGSFNCNNGVFKFDLAHLRADMEIPTGCRNLEITIKNISVGGAEFRWNFGDGSPEVVTYSPVDVTHKFPETGTYTITLTATDFTTCQKVSIKNTITTVHRDVSSNIHFDTLCLNGTATVAVTKQPTDQFIVWSPTELVENDAVFETKIIDPIIQNTQVIAEVSDSLGCSRTETFNVIPVDINGGFIHEKIGTCEQGGTPTILFKNITNSTLAYNTSWDFGDGGTSTEKEVMHTYKQEGKYLVKHKLSFKGCLHDTKDTITISPLTIPNIITPNEDGKNDAFVIKGIEGTGDWKFELHNRWGKLLYEDEQYKNDYKAKGLNDGLYYYLITAPDETTCKGWVDITR